MAQEHYNPIPVKRDRVRPDDVEIGRPIPFDIEDAYGRVLVARGQVVKTPQQQQRLLQIGRTPYHTASRRQTGGVSERGISGNGMDLDPFSEIYHLSMTLQQAFKNLGQGKGRFLQRLDGLLSRIGDLVERDPDAAVGAAHLDEEFPYSVRHPLRQALLCDIVGHYLDISDGERRAVVSAALTANVGMLDLEAQLEKQDAPLTKEQTAALRQHPLRSVELLRAEEVEDPEWLRIVAEHHERMDGSGYPNGLQGDRICLGARLLAIADTYMAMVSNRAYRPANAVRDALLELLDQSGSIYDRKLLSKLIQTIGIYPAGSLVALDNSERGVVIRRGKESTKPLVAVIIKANGERTARPLLRDTSLADTPDVESLLPPSAITTRLNLAALWGYGSSQ